VSEYLRRLRRCADYCIHTTRNCHFGPPPLNLSGPDLS
jgi:hypothetical protein